HTWSLSCGPGRSSKKGSSSKPPPNQPPTPTTNNKSLNFSSTGFDNTSKNVMDRQVWDTREQLRLAIVGWIEGKYHRKRRQRTLGKLTPIEFETIMDPAATLAA